ncbi:MAG: serine hydrolase, partial [Phycicoccus sp.]
MDANRTGPTTDTATRPTTRPATRRAVLALGVGAGVAAAAPRTAATPPVPGRPADTRSSREAYGVDADVVELERRYATRIGVSARRLDVDAALAHRIDDRQPMCSTFKALAAAILLRRGVDLDRVVRYSDRDVVEYSPITGMRRSMTYGEICDAAVRYSDNTAGNLALEAIGGPTGLTAALRRTGDHVTRLDRWETDLNSAIPG